MLLFPQSSLERQKEVEKSSFYVSSSLMSPCHFYCDVAYLSRQQKGCKKSSTQESDKERETAPTKPEFSCILWWFCKLLTSRLIFYALKNKNILIAAATALKVAFFSLQIFLSEEIHSHDFSKVYWWEHFCTSVAKVKILIPDAIVTSRRGKCSFNLKPHFAIVLA